MPGAAHFSHFITVKRRRIPVLNRRGKLKRSRAGRPRQEGARWPSGDLIQGDPRAVVMAQPHRRHWPMLMDDKGRKKTDGRLDQRAESPIGALRMWGHIEPAEYAAALTYRKQHKRFVDALESRDALARNSGGGRGGEPDPGRILRAIEVYEAALGCLDRRAAPVVGRVVLRHQPMAGFETADLKRGLMQLAKYYRLT